MTREIKFRAWDKENRIMHQPVSLLSNWDNQTMSYKQETHQFTYGQYTGLKDKNGKEIYEGDVVKFDDGEDWETGREEVKFMNGAFNICCFHPEQKEFIDEPRVMEIIGNIYENPDLLSTQSVDKK